MPYWRIFLFFSCNLFCSVTFCASYVYNTHYFKQKVDHFGYSNLDNFLQRYLVADQYWNHDGGPIFFYTGNEGDITMFANNTGFMWEHAPKFEALLIFAEHRYYGVSMPYGDSSYSSPEHRGYLTSEQALADFATLIYYLKANLKGAKQSPVIAFGGSYGGMLAAWMRMKYPHIINGALASSAPVFQLNGLTPCGRFSQIVTDDFAQAGSQCVASIRKSWNIIRALGKTATGAKWLSLNFHLCENLSKGNVDQLIHWISETWQYLAMTDYPYPTNFLLPLPGYPINETCKYLRNSAEPDKVLLFHLFQAVSVFHNYTGNVQCFNLSQSTRRSLGEQGWYFQSCTEMVMPLCSDGVADMFEPNYWNFTQYTEDCKKRWHVTPDNTKAIILYGGRNITAASNIFFSNGKLDPWSAGGVLQSLSETLVAYVIDNAAHHLDLRKSNVADPASVVKARALELIWISRWIRQATHKACT